MDPLTGAAAISAGANLVGNFANQGLTRRQNRRMIEFWKMQNEYNHPTQQMARLREAGLNPNLIYGDSVSGATGRADQVKPEKPIPFDFRDTGNSIMHYQNVKRASAQADLLRSQNTTENVNALYRSAQAAGEVLSNVSKKAQAGVADEIAKTSLQAQQMTVRNMQQDFIKKQLDNERISETQKTMIAQEFERLANLKKTGTNIEASTALRQLEADLKRQGLENAPYYARWLYRKLHDSGILDGESPFSSELKFD